MAAIKLIREFHRRNVFRFGAAYAATARLPIGMAETIRRLASGSSTVRFLCLGRFWKFGPTRTEEVVDGPAGPHGAIDLTRVAQDGGALCDSLTR